MSNSSVYMAEYMAKRRADRRQKLIDLLGGKCVHCGSIESLQFDHIIPGSQSFRINGRKLDGPWEKILAEVAKCQLLCPPCHRIKTVECGEHGGGWNKITECGTEAVYMQGCRCEPCRKARHDARVGRGELKGIRRNKRKTLGDVA